MAKKNKIINQRGNSFISSIDPMLAMLFACLLILGLVMVASSSIAIAERMHGQSFYYLNRQLIALMLGITMGFICLLTPVHYWQQNSKALLGIAIVLLILVLIPGIGKVVNGSYRWIPVGVFNLQVSEVMKFCFIIYLASYLVRKKIEVQNSVEGFVIPILVLGLAALLLLLEPDLGAAVVLSSVALGLLLIAGVPLTRFFLAAMIMAVLGISLIILEPYRFERLKSFTDPWLDPLDKGFQLTQSLMAFGRADWFGVGLGNSLQKQFYLPEAHTDFIFAIIGEELGIVGAVIIISLFFLLIYKIFTMAFTAIKEGKLFEAYLLFGFSIWIGVQAFINIGVNMGVLPTKGLTLPFISYGGSSIIVMSLVIAIILRIDYESKTKKPFDIVAYLLGGKKSHVK